MALSGHQRELLHKLYRKEPPFQRFAEWAERRLINARKTTVTTVEEKTGLNRQHAIDLMQDIAATGIAEFKRGAGGKVSELAWRHDIREVGKAAREGLFGG